MMLYLVMVLAIPMNTQVCGVLLIASIDVIDSHLISQIMKITNNFK